MQCAFCSNRFSENELDQILAGSSKKCGGCGKIVTLNDLITAYSPQVIESINRKNTFLELIKDLISLNILRKDETTGITSLHENNFKDELLKYMVDRDYHRIYLAMVVIRFILEKYYEDKEYAPYIMDILFLLIKIDFILYWTSKKNLSSKEQHIRTSEMLFKKTSEKLLWCVEANKRSALGAGNTKFIDFLGTGYGQIASPIINELAYNGYISSILTWKDALDKIKNEVL